MEKYFPDRLHVGFIPFSLRLFRYTVVGRNRYTHQDSQKDHSDHQLHQGETIPIYRFLNQNFNLLMNLKLKYKKIQLVHNDLNHSNIIIEKNNAKFIDIEDICYDYLQQAIAHLFFKVTRHSIYNRKISIYNLKKNYLPKIIKMLLNDFKFYKSKFELYQFCILRILSDIAEIIKLYKFKKDNKYMYDIEKKIHNLFEVYFILY